MAEMTAEDILNESTSSEEEDDQPVPGHLNQDNSDEKSDSEKSQNDDKESDKAKLSEEEKKVEFPDDDKQELVKSDGSDGDKGQSAEPADSTEGLNDFQDINSSDKGNDDKGSVDSDGKKAGKRSRVVDAARSFVQQFKSSDDNPILAIQKSHTLKNDIEAAEDMKRQNSKDESDLDFKKTASQRQGMSRASNIFKSFTAGFTTSNKFNSGSKPRDAREQKETSKKGGKGKDDDDDHMSEDEKKRMLAAIMDDDSSDEESNSDDEVSQNSAGLVKNKDSNSDSGSFISDKDIYNRDLQEDFGEAIDSQNYLRYASEKYNQKLDILEIVDKNERSFKQVAERMIQQSSQLIEKGQPELMSTSEVQDSSLKRRLTSTKTFTKIADRFHGDVQIAQGVPYSIAALEDFIAIGSSDGSVRLFDHSEQEIKALTDRSVKGCAVTFLDIRRIGPHKNIYIISGHLKGQIALYEIKGLLEQEEFLKRQNSNNAFIKASDNLFGNVSFKHCKTIDDIHQTTIASVKFMGDLTQQIQVISSDVKGIVYLTEFTDSLLRWKTDKQCLMSRRLGASFSIAPLIDLDFKSRNDTTRAYLEVMKKLDNNVYNTEKERQVQMQRLAQQQGSQLVGFGSLEEVYIAQIRPKALPLVSIRRPPYIQAGTVPYLDWGYALTPTFRDQSYPVIAIAWGRTIQLGVYSNQKMVNQDIEEPQIILDGFYICEASSIDQCFFLSESIILIIVDKKEVRILYTQNFTPGVFDPDYPCKNPKGRKVGGDAQAEDEQPVIRNFTRIKSQYAGQVSAYAEKDRGYRMLEEEIRHKDNNQMMDEKDMKSKFNFNPTVCKNLDFNVIALGKQTIGQRDLIHWREYLDLIRRTNPDDWLKVLRAALDIYNGRMVGLAGLPDQREKREIMLRERMKDLLRNNIDACIKEFQEGENVSKSTLRVATEFCIRVGAIDHLFGELFQMFAEAGIEQKYFQNLDAFILSGALKKSIIPDHILGRLIDFYRQTDVELLEKAILNLNLSKYPNAVQVRHICEEEFLSSALIHLLTTLFDDERDTDAAICISILCSLFNLMVRSKTDKTREEIFTLPQYVLSQGTSIFQSQNFTPELSKTETNTEEEIKKFEEYKKNRSVKLEIEHSKSYIGYKLLWVISLFIEGKKFPSGSLSSFKWRCYIYDIVRFLTNERFLSWFLKFDPHSFMQIIKKIFLEQEPYEFIRTQNGFMEMYKEQVIGLEPCNTHEEIIEILDQNVQKIIDEYKQDDSHESAVKSESLQNSFTFFLTQISKKRKIKISQELCIRVILDQIQFHKRLLKLPKEDLKQLIPQTQETRKIKDRTYNIYTYLVKKNEIQILSLLKRHQNKLTEETIKQILDEAETAPLFKLRVLLYQLLGNFQKCLKMFFDIRSIKADIFNWLESVQESLERSQTVDNDAEEEGSDEEAGEFGFFEQKGVPYRITIEKMKELIFTQISDFVLMDPVQTVKLCDMWFERDYESIAKALKGHKDLCFNFLNTVITQNEEKITEEYEDSVMTSAMQVGPSTKFTNLLLHFVEILCEKKFRSKIVEYVSRNYFPVEASLKICNEKGALEASAVLYKRQGMYSKSIDLYVQVLCNLGSDIMYTLFDLDFQDINQKSNEHIHKFDQIMQNIVKICEKNSSRTSGFESEDLWLQALEHFFGIKGKVFSNIPDDDEDDDDSDSDFHGNEEKVNFKRFMMNRNQYFLQRMSEYVNLRRIFDKLQELGHFMEYQEFKQTFRDKVTLQGQMENILLCARSLLRKEQKSDSEILEVLLSKGVLNNNNMCDACQRPFDMRWDKQEVWLFNCNHIFHARCIAKTEGKCSVCFDELEAFQNIISTTKRAKPKSGGSAIRRRMNSQSFINEDSAGSSTSTQSDTDEFDQIKKKAQQSLQQSKDFILSQGRDFISKDERQNNLMQDYEYDTNIENLSYLSFRQEE